MIRALVLPLFAFSSAVIAHPGHGGALGHLHEWEWGHVLLYLVIAAGIIGLAVRSLRRGR